MNADATQTWQLCNQRYLVQEMNRVWSSIEQRADAGNEAPTSPAAEQSSSMNPLPAIQQLCAAFNLSPFERDLVLLCAGAELSSRLAQPLAQSASTFRRAPTFSVALSALERPHWDAISPAAPLRLWHIVELGGGDSLVDRPLRLDERILHYIAGVSQMDERLCGIAERVSLTRQPSASRVSCAREIARLWIDSLESSVPIVHLSGVSRDELREIAAMACAECDLDLYAVPAEAIPSRSQDFDLFFRLWQREALLGRCALLVEGPECARDDPQHDALLSQLLERMHGVMLTSGGVTRRTLRRAIAEVSVSPLTSEERDETWQRSLGEAARLLNGKLDEIRGQFVLESSEIRGACYDAKRDTTDSVTFHEALWNACRIRSRPKGNQLAQRVSSAAGWKDLVLPESQMSLLREMTLHVRNRARVYEDWGFSHRASRGLGIGALFAGPSGTGKTMAAEVIANELNLDLYRIDLSQVVSKYIGETEKNLARVFESMECGSGILLFDEADALFGRRSEVKDSHDRYANVEISYLLQRMEAYRGLSILTTNMHGSIDPAFLRRLRFVVHFPFPKREERKRIWELAFPPAAPLDPMDWQGLAEMEISGGSIASIAMNAAFLAAEDGEVIRHRHILDAARSEYAKLERPFTDNSTRRHA